MNYILIRCPGLDPNDNRRIVFPKGNIRYYPKDEKRTYPLVGADALEGLEELLAASELLTTSVDALVVIAVRLPAVLALVGVGETSVEGSYSVQFENQENMSDWLVNWIIGIVG